MKESAKPSHHLTPGVEPLQHRGWVRLLAVVAAIAIIVCSYATVLRDNFGTAAKVTVFLKNAQTFSHIADIVKSEVQTNLPASVKDNFLQNALAAKLLDVIITPENVAKVAEPALTAAYKISSKTDAKVVNDNVVVDSSKYKEQASKFVNDVKLPEVLSSPLNSIIQSAPGEIKVVDGQKNPNSVLLQLVKLKALFQNVSYAVTISWWVIVLSLAAIVALNWRNYRALLRVAGLSLAIPGLIITIGSWMFAPIVLLFVPQSTDAVIGDSINQATVGVITQYFTLTRPYGFFLVLFGVVLYALYRWNVIERAIKLVQSKTKQHAQHKK